MGRLVKACVKCGVTAGTVRADGHCESCHAAFSRASIDLRMRIIAALAAGASNAAALVAEMEGLVRAGNPYASDDLAEALKSQSKSNRSTRKRSHD